MDKTEEHKHDAVDSSASTIASVTTENNGTEGRWGEIQGDVVDVGQALEEFTEMDRTLSQYSQRQRTPRHSNARKPDEEEAQLAAEPDFVGSQDLFRRDKGLGVSFRDLSVHGWSGDRTFVRTFTDAMIGAFGLDLLLLGRTLLMEKNTASNARNIIQGLNGLVKPGEMLLVLGKPGSGTTTLLRALTNQPRAGTIVQGRVNYGGIDPEGIATNFRGEVVFNDEDDVHFPTLTVQQTLGFALRSKVPRRRMLGHTRREFVDSLLKLFVSMFGMSHTLKTIVGSAWVPGVSGGERKRVSIMEALSSGATVIAWDNSTRGLDSSTAVDYIKSLRVMTTATNITNIVTLYQAGESIYQLFDKVSVVAFGRQIFFGRVSEARNYFESLGFKPKPGSTTADFLTSITEDELSDTARDIEKDTKPRTAEELETAFKSSPYFTRLLEEIEQYDRELEEQGHRPAADFRRAVIDGKSRSSSKKSPYTQSFPMQVANAFRRDIQIQWQDPITLGSKIINSIILGLIMGALFYNLPFNSTGVFARGGILFFASALICWAQLSEGLEIVAARPVIVKQQALGFARPAAYIIAKTLSDLPTLSIQMIFANTGMYWLSGLDADAGKFFIQLLINITLGAGLTSLYRAIGVFSKDFNVVIRWAFMCLNVFALFGGYFQPRPKMRVWYRWFSYLSPLSYSQEALLANQLSGANIPCDPVQLIPGVPGASVVNQACSVLGAEAGAATFSGSRYLLVQFGFTKSHLWRNFGILCVFFIGFTAIAVIGSEIMHFPTGSSRTVKIFKKGESEVEASAKMLKPRNGKQAPAEVDRVQGVTFTWRNLNYTIAGAQLLYDVAGVVRPGKLTALMGPSGAGKTTLLNTLARRHRGGEITGEVLLDGKTPSAAFGRATGFVEQQDIHDETATVREALTFSALLRQSRSVSKEEKLKTVNEAIQVLELDSIQDALIGPLNVEEKKRVTIGVEIAAKPQGLLFLDEPTSGLDSNGALSIILLLRRLADETGLSILCTIHQPSGILFDHFDELLLLNGGGKQVYMGPVGRRGKEAINYFERNGAQPAAFGANPAEYILDITRPSEGGIDWPKVWNTSGEASKLNKEIGGIIERGQASTISETANTYAVNTYTQIIEVTKRVWRHYYREPSYGFSKIFSSISMSLATGILFFQLGPGVVDMQSRGFAVFSTFLLVPLLIPAVQPMFYGIRGLYESRERGSQIYSAWAWLTALTICEIPYAILGSVFYFLPWYYMVGSNGGSSNAGRQYVTVLLMEVFAPHFGMWIAAVSPNLTIVNIINPFMFATAISVTGIVIPWNQLPSVHKYFVYFANPLTWAGRALQATALHGVEVTCTKEELVVFQPPVGETCMSYAGEWLRGATGYINNPNATADCSYCQYANGDEYLNFLNVHFEDRNKYIGMFIVFMVTNIILIYATYFAFREIQWKKVLRRSK